MLFREVQKVVSICKYAVLRDIGDPGIAKNEVEKVDEHVMTNAR